MSSPIRQTNFSAGELDPLLWGRTDLAKWAAGLRRCRDFFASKQGAAVSRPGTSYIAEIGEAGARLVPFVYSDTQSYVLVFGDFSLKVYSYGTLVVTVISPYAVADLPQLQWAQTGDVLTVCHRSYPPQEVVRAAHAIWAISPVNFTPPAPAVTLPSIELPLPVEDSTHPARDWVWAITSLERDQWGNIRESAPWHVTIDSTSTALAPLPVYIDKPVSVSISPSYSFPYPNRLIAYRVYRGRGGLFGWVGDTLLPVFVDVGEEPDYSRAPPQGKNPFEVLDGDGNVSGTEYPSAVTFFEERRVFGGTTDRPGFLFLSATGDYTNFDDRLIQVADEALTFDLASRKREEIRSLVGLNKMLAFTNASAWAVGGAGGPLSFDSVDAKVQAEIGATRLPPLVVDGAVLYTRVKGVGVRALVFDLNGGGYQSLDLSALASHMFTGVVADPEYSNPDPTPLAISDWTYAEDPWGLVWLVRNDGVLLSLTFDKEGQTWAWARHETEGLVTAICSVPEGDEDAVYMMVTRVITGAGESTQERTKYYLEKMASRVRKGSADDDAAVDCAGRYEGTPTKTITGLDHLEGMSVYACALNNVPQGPYTVTGGAITLGKLPTTDFLTQDINQSAVVVVHVGLLYQPELETLDVAHSATRGKQKNVTEVLLEVEQSKGLWAGQDFDHLVEWKQRTVSGGYNPPSSATELVRVPVRGTWDASARAAIRQTLPLPVTVVGLTRLVDMGD